MNQRARFRREREAAMLARMESTRTQLLAANVVLRMDEQASRGRENALTLSNIGRALVAAPNITLLGSVVLGSLLLGPRRIAPLVLRTGMTGWIARNVRAFVAR
jgi:hypothetical protein